MLMFSVRLNINQQDENNLFYDRLGKRRLCGFL